MELPTSIQLSELTKSCSSTPFIHRSPSGTAVKPVSPLTTSLKTLSPNEPQGQLTLSMPHPDSTKHPRAPLPIVPATREAARKAIVQTVGQSSSGKRKASGDSGPVFIAADDLFTDAEVLEDTENELPTEKQLRLAASLDVINESGLKVPFGYLWLGQRTVVCFIRHFWCPLCQDYMYSISQHVDPAVLQRADIRLVVISNGSHKMIKAYRRIFKTPFDLYTDPTLQVYHAMGMTLRTMDGGLEAERGGYVKHGLFGGIAMVVGNAFKHGIPLFEEGGDIPQVGGEFVLGPGYKCIFAHRMRTTRSHTSISKVLAAAGVDVSTTWERSSSSNKMTVDEEETWMEGRRRSMARIRSQRNLRRGTGFCACEEPVPEVVEEELDDETEYSSASDPEYVYSSESGDSSVAGRATSRKEMSIMDGYSLAILPSNSVT